MFFFRVYEIAAFSRIHITNLLVSLLTTEPTKENMFIFVMKTNRNINVVFIPP